MKTYVVVTRIERFENFIANLILQDVSNVQIVHWLYWLERALGADRLEFLHDFGQVYAFGTQ